MGKWSQVFCCHGITRTRPNLCANIPHAWESESHQIFFISKSWHSIETIKCPLIELARWCLRPFCSAPAKHTPSDNALSHCDVTTRVCRRDGGSRSPRNWHLGTQAACEVDCFSVSLTDSGANWSKVACLSRSVSIFNRWRSERGIFSVRFCEKVNSHLFTFDYVHNDTSLSTCSRFV